MVTAGARSRGPAASGRRDLQGCAYCGGAGVPRPLIARGAYMALTAGSMLSRRAALRVRTTRFECKRNRGAYRERHFCSGGRSLWQLFWGGLIQSSQIQPQLLQPLMASVTSSNRQAVSRLRGVMPRHMPRCEQADAFAWQSARRLPARLAPSAGICRALCRCGPSEPNRGTPARSRDTLEYPRYGVLVPTTPLRTGCRAADCRFKEKLRYFFEAV